MSGYICYCQDFLLLEEKSHDVYSSCGIKLPEDIVVSFENFSAFPPASGDKISYAASLQTLNFTINRGHLIVIVGPPGSGKVCMARIICAGIFC